MSDGTRQIRMTARPITLAPKAPGGLGLREVALLVVAVMTGLFIIFSWDGPSFGVRIAVATMVALVLFIAAVFRPHGNTIERAMLNAIRKRLRANFFVHQTAERDTNTERLGDVAGKPAAPVAVQPETSAQTPCADDHAGWDWLAPNYALMVLAFMMVVMLTTMALYSVHGGHLPGLPRLPVAVPNAGSWR